MQIPPELPDEDAATTFFDRLICVTLLSKAYLAKAGGRILLPAATGAIGGGLLMTHLLKFLSAKIIRNAGCPERVARVKSVGANHVIDCCRAYGGSQMEELVAIIEGPGMDLILDPVRNDMLTASLDAACKKETVIWIGERQ